MLHAGHPRTQAASPTRSEASQRAIPCRPCSKPNQKARQTAHSHPRERSEQPSYREAAHLHVVGVVPRSNRAMAASPVRTRPLGTHLRSTLAPAGPSDMPGARAGASATITLRRVPSACEGSRDERTEVGGQG